MTKRTSPLPLLAALAFAAGAAPIAAQEPDPEKPTYAGGQVDAEYRIVETDEVDGLEQSLKDEHKQALEAHKAAVKAAKAAKQKPPAAPKAKKLKVVKTKLDEAEAKELLAKLEAKSAKKAQRKETPPAKTPPKKRTEPARKKQGGSGK